VNCFEFKISIVFQEVKSLVQDLQTLETLVYEVEMVEITLDYLKSLSDIERLRLLLSKVLTHNLLHFIGKTECIVP